jgi:hypothetical protein
MLRESCRTGPVAVSMTQLLKHNAAASRGRHLMFMEAPRQEHTRAGGGLFRRGCGLERALR